MESSTKTLRRLLDERGVHWWAGEDERKTLWESNGLTWEYFNNENGDAWLGFLGACEQDVTPEQAIAATFGLCNCSSNCTNGERTETCRNVAADGFECSECKGWWVGPRGTENPMLWGFRFCPTCGRRVVQ